MSRIFRSLRIARPLAILIALLLMLAPPGIAAAQPRLASGPVLGQAAANVLSLTVTPAKAQVGEQIQVQATGLAPGAAVDLSWETVSGGWVTRDYYHFGGKQFADSTQSLGAFQVGNDGRLAAEFTARRTTASCTILAP